MYPKIIEINSTRVPGNKHNEIEREKRIDRLVSHMHLHRDAHIYKLRADVAIMCGPISPTGDLGAPGAVRGTVCGIRDRREPLITDAESISISRGFTTCDAGHAVAKAAHLALRLPGKLYDGLVAATSRIHVFSRSFNVSYAYTCYVRSGI